MYNGFMDNVITYSIISVSLVSSISLIGIIFVAFTSKFVNGLVSLLVSLAAGTLLGDVFFHIIPELSVRYSFDQKVSLYLVSGILFFFILEHILDWRHCHDGNCGEHTHPVAVNNIIADGIHNFLDGVVIGASFGVSVHLGVLTTIAVVLHEVPQELGDFGILVSAGYSKRKALLFNLLSSSLAFLGLVVVFFLGEEIGGLKYQLLSFSAGGFIYISMSDLMPSIRHEMNFRKRLPQLLMVIFGITLMYLFAIVE